MVFNPNSLSFVVGEFKLGSGDVPIDDALPGCDSDEAEGESVFDTLELPLVCA
jgi:hypothetical protein